MKRLTIQREPDTDEGTFGTGSFPGSDTWQFLELPWRDNAQGLSRIEAGVYVADLLEPDQTHFHRHIYRLRDVPDRTDVEMHPANFAGDVTKGFHSELKGCCAPGFSRGELPTPDGKVQKAVLHSGIALDAIIEFAGSDPIEIEFVDPANG